MDGTVNSCATAQGEDCTSGSGLGLTTDAIMDRIIHNTIWIETGSYNMREKIGAD
ncbi:hypothetical protein [Paeniglutamicibacter sp. ZC-3]|uniref:hypothetical protein n=1 Tax=Paeniglutamicibacter sp. ZC-3 TaxID=2986919 RepID=UPI003555CE60